MDIDDELQMLQRQLMAVQQEKTNPLSQRTVAEIMIKLYQQGFKFFATTDGNEYITPTKLDNEIIQFVQERGRTKIGILPQLLNLNQDLIQARINQVCQKSTHIRNNDNLLSKDYIRNFVHSLKQKLQIDGIVQLEQVALTQQFNMPFLMKIINQNLQQLDAEIVSNQLVTKQYRRMKQRKILGFLLAISRPVHIDTFLKTIKLSDSNPQVLIEQLIAEGKLKGRCQNTYYIPDKFSKNQKQMIQKSFEVQGYLDFSMLQKNYQVSKPQQWIKKNLKGDYILFEEICFNKNKLQYYQAQVYNLMKAEGFFEISNVIPFQMDDETMEKFLTQSCGIKNFILDKGICYSQDWLSKCINQFRDKAVYEIFFKKNDGKGKKKGGKKQKQQGIVQQQLIQTIFDAGLAQYSVAENIADSLLPLINVRFDKLKTQLQKQLTQNQGIINNAFLKYRKCKTIIKSPQNLQRVLNTIDKQKKKGTQWVDPDFGPIQTDPQGKFSLIYYDSISPNQWPPLENITWNAVNFRQIVNNPPQKSVLMKKSLLVNILQILDYHNQTSSLKIEVPNFSKIPTRIQQNEQQPSPPYAFKFYIREKQSKFVLIDNKMPSINEQPVSSGGLYGLIEKAYAKLRYCYKGILNIGIQQLILQLTGSTSSRIVIDNQKDQAKALQDLLSKYLSKDNLVIVMGEGEAGKKLKLQGDNTEFRSFKPYLISKRENQDNLLNIFPNPSSSTIQAKLVPKIFKNIYIVQIAK